MSEIKAIETAYKGCRFRSRTEARWAVFLDAFGAKWAYELEGFHLEGERYLPDFYVRGVGQDGVWLEVKGTKPSDRELARCRLLAKHTRRVVYCVVGSVGRGDFEVLGWDEAGATLPNHRVFVMHLAVLLTGASPFCVDESKLIARFNRALDQGRSARFEWGECPAPEAPEVDFVRKPRVYLAGRISMHDWRDDGGRGAGDESFWKDGFPDQDRERYVFTGPTFRPCDHGCAHGDSRHGLVSDWCFGESLPRDPRAVVVRHCLEAIQGSDVVFAWLEKEAYGTVAELGYAKALGKLIVVAGPESHTHVEHVSGEDVEVVEVEPDLWFTVRLADVVLDEETPTAAVERMLDRLTFDGKRWGIR